MIMDNICYSCNSDKLSKIDCRDLNIIVPEKYPLSGEIELNLCDICGVVRNKTTSSEEDYGIYYKTVYQKSIKQKNSEKDLKYFKDFLTGFCNIQSGVKLKCLDFGSGLSPLKNILEELGHSCESADVHDSIKDSKLYDFIFCTHVFEHIFNPKNLLIDLRSRLTDLGKICISVPDADRYIDIYQGPFNAIDLEHINHWNENALINFVGNDYLECEKSERCGNGILYPELRIITGKNSLLGSAGMLEANINPLLRYIDRSHVDLKLLRERFSEILNQSSKVYIWGCSTFLFRLINKLTIKQQNAIAGFIDINHYLHDKIIFKKKIQNPSEVIQDLVREDCIVVLCAVRSKNIKSHILKIVDLPETKIIDISNGLYENKSIC